jgi:hypothetical protein
MGAHGCVYCILSPIRTLITSPPHFPLKNQNAQIMGKRVGAAQSVQQWLWAGQSGFNSRQGRKIFSCPQHPNLI